MIEINVNPGICGFNTVIIAESTDGMSADIEIKSDCPAVKSFSERIKKVDVMNDVFSPFGSSLIFKEASSTITHAACPVPTAVLKAAEAAANLALPADVIFKMTKK